MKCGKRLFSLDISYVGHLEFTFVATIAVVNEVGIEDEGGVEAYQQFVDARILAEVAIGRDIDVK